MSQVSWLMLETIIIWCALILSFLGPVFVIYLFDRKFLRGKSWILRLVVALPSYCFLFLVFLFAMLATGAIPFRR